VVGGGSLTLSDLRGKVVILDFMATWCGPCATEIEHLKTVRNQYSSSNVVIVSVDVDPSETDPLLISYANEKGITWTIVRDVSDVSSQPGYDVSGIPTIVILDQNGFITYRNVGVAPSSALIGEINALVGISGGEDGTPGFDLWVLFIAMVVAFVMSSILKKK
jgi:thiol-disulfide isomerase/thioredoxin